MGQSFRDARGFWFLNILFVGLYVTLFADYSALDGCVGYFFILSPFHVLRISMVILNYMGFVLPGTGTCVSGQVIQVVRNTRSRRLVLKVDHDH